MTARSIFEGYGGNDNLCWEGAWKIAIIGSRNVVDPEGVKLIMENRFKWAAFLPKVRERQWIKIIHGGAKGVDQIADKFAKKYNYEVQVIIPDYGKFGGKAAPHIRNREIINEADTVLAFWDGKSKGTKSGIDYAKSRNKQIEVIPIHGHPDFLGIMPVG